MAKLIAPPSVAYDLRTQALMPLIARLGALDLTQILIYNIETVPDSAILALAWQFDMLQPAWELLLDTSPPSPGQGTDIDSLEDIDSLLDIDALTLASGGSGGGIVAPTNSLATYRTLLQEAIPLHSKLGTPAAIKQALLALGWHVSLLEGQNSWGGTSWPPNEGWAVFRVIINVIPGQSATQAQFNQIINAIDFFKPERSWLDSITFLMPPIFDQLPIPTDSLVNIFSRGDILPVPMDIITAPFYTVADTKITVATYNHHFNHIGITYGGAQPVLVDSGVDVNGTPISAKG